MVLLMNLIVGGDVPQISMYIRGYYIDEDGLIVLSLMIHSLQREQLGGGLI